MPAPALISPVDCSSTSISIIFKLLADPSLTSYFTSLNNPLAFISAMDFSRLRFVKGSPSSKINSPLITSSLVVLFPVTFILSTNFFSPSNILKIILILSSSIISSTLCSTNCKLLFSIKISISSKSFLTLKGE